MHAAGIFAHIAADGAGDLARRIGRVVQAMRRGEPDTTAFLTPGWTTATRASGSMRRTRMNFAMESSTPSPGGSAAG